MSWDLLNLYLVIIQHEVFGHGYRIRDLGSRYATVEGYHFGWDSAATHFEITDRLTSSQMSAIAIGGVEATAILANRLRLKWLTKSLIDGRQSNLYFHAEQDLTLYTMSTYGSLIGPSDAGHDIENYLFFLNATYPKGNLSKHQLRKRALLNFLDPFTYYAFYAWWNFVITGESFTFPMIPIGQYRYMPSFRLGLTPFGPEFFLENFLVKNNHPIYFYFKWGKYAGNRYYGLGIEQSNVYTWHGIEIGYRLDLWRQPRVLFQRGALQAEQLFAFPSVDLVPPLYPQSTLDKKQYGVAFSLMLQKTLGLEWLSLYLEPGFKTAGFLPGQALRMAPIFRGGFAFRF